MKLGDTVRIIDSGQVYVTYSEMAEHMNLLHWESGTIQRDINVPFTVVDMKEHSAEIGKMLCGIDNGEISLIIGAKGLEVIKKRPLTNRRKKSEEYWKTREKIGV